MPVLGGVGAQLVGEMWLAKHWETLAQRADPTRPHLLVVDEAHLFASGLLPRLLLQARKFGVAVVLAHHGCSALGDSTSMALRRAMNLEEAATMTYRLILAGDTDTDFPAAFLGRIISI